MIYFKNKVAVITGGSSGIGFALANELGRRGAKVIISGRNVDNLLKAKNILTEIGINVLAVESDVSNEADCNNLIKKAIEWQGRIDILINNAGISMRASFNNVKINVLKELMNTNFWGTVYCTHYAMPYLLQSKGSLVGIISVAGYIGLPGRTGYSASKFAVRGFLNTIRVENLKKGLHVLVAAPGFTESNIRISALTADGSLQNKTPRDESKMMSAERCAKKIIKAIEKRKNSIILTFLEGKFTVFLNKFCPKLVDKLSYNHMAKEPNSPI